MGKYISYIIFATLIILTGCFGKSEQLKKPEQFIPQQKMQDILFDLYISDGLLNNPQVRNDFNYKDSIQNYMDVIELHGYSEPLFEENLNYYFLQKPKKIEAIYDNILADLSRVEADLMQKRESTNRMNRNLWSGKNIFNLPDDGLNNMIEFDIPLVGVGKYTISARLLIYEDDQAINPRTLVWFWKDDGTEAGIMDIWDPVKYEKSGKVEILSISRDLTDSTFTHLRGRLLDHTAQSGHWEKHSQVTGILVNFRAINIDQ